MKLINILTLLSAINVGIVQANPLNWNNLSKWSNKNKQIRNETLEKGQTFYRIKRSNANCTITSLPVKNMGKDKMKKKKLYAEFKKDGFIKIHPKQKIEFDFGKNGAGLFNWIFKANPEKNTSAKFYVEDASGLEVKGFNINTKDKAKFANHIMQYSNYSKKIKNLIKTTKALYLPKASKLELKGIMGGKFTIENTSNAPIIIGLEIKDMIQLAK